jgi:hypothetical protein
MNKIFSEVADTSLIFLKKIAKILDKLLTDCYNTIDWTMMFSLVRQEVLKPKGVK